MPTSCFSSSSFPERFVVGAVFSVEDWCAVKRANRRVELTRGVGLKVKDSAAIEVVGRWVDGEKPEAKTQTPAAPMDA